MYSQIQIIGAKSPMRLTILVTVLTVWTLNANATPKRTCDTDRHWATEAINGDLMVEAMENWRKVHPGIEKTKIAIVDSGLRKSHESKLDAKISYHTVSDKVVKAEVAGFSHGYSVASLYSSEIGLYKGSSLAIYGVSIPNTKSGVDGEAAKASYLDACSKGYKIINASHGSFPNRYIDQDEKADAELLANLAEKGCLVIKSAGNSAVKEGYITSEANIDDSYLRVASTRFTGGLAIHSNLGEVSAPGEKIYGLEYEPDGACKDENGSLISGTSFAGPLSGTVAASVREVLSASPNFERLSGKNQLTLISRHLKGSSQNGYDFIDGYRAVKLAMSWLNNSDRIPSIEDIQKVRLSDPICTTFDHAKANKKEYRKALSICDNLSENSLNTTIDRMVNGKDYHLINRLQEALLRNPGFKLTSHQTAGFDYWRGIINSRLKYNYDDFSGSSELFKTAIPSQFDLPGVIDLYLSLRGHIPSEIKIQTDTLLATAVVSELASIPAYWANFPGPDLMPPGFYSEPKVANEVGRLLLLNVGEEALAEGLVTNVLNGKPHAFHQIMIYGPFQSAALQTQLKRLLSGPIPNQTPTDLMIYAHTGAVPNPYQWLADVLESPRFFEKKFKEDYEYQIDLSFEKGYISETEKGKLMGILERRWAERQL